MKKKVQELISGLWLVSDLPEKRSRDQADDSDVQDGSTTNFQDWKRRILENAAKANS